MTNQTAPVTAQDKGSRSVCLQRLATALSGHSDQEVTVLAGGAAPYLTARNIGVPSLSERVAVTRVGDRLAFTWSWGERIGDASNPDAAAQAIAYVLGACDARLGQ